MPRVPLHCAHVQTQITCQPFPIAMCLSIHDKRLRIPISRQQFHEFHVEIRQPPRMIPRVFLARFQRSLHNSFERTNIIHALRRGELPQVDEGSSGQDVSGVGCPEVDGNRAEMQRLPRFFAHVIFQQRVLDYDM